MSFYRDTIRTARKVHKCSLCHGVIQKGEKYHDKAGNAIDESNVYSAKECEACQLVIQEYVESGAYDSSEGYCDEYIQEWWRDVKCYNCKHEYLPCQPDCNCNEPEGCTDRTKHGTCAAGDTCDEMTHYCRCEKLEKAE